MSGPEWFADRLGDLKDTLVTRSGIRSSQFAVGDVVFAVTGPRGRTHWMGSAFFETEQASVKTNPDHTLFVWDGTGGSASPPSRPWGESGHEPLGIVSSYSNETVRCAFDVHTSSMIVDDHRRAISYTWYPDIDELPAWAQASPFRIPLSWELNRHGMQIVHGAAISVEGRGALLAGAGGAGKSTTALACALAGLGYLGDDYCVVDPRAGKVHMLYRTAKILPSSLSMLPQLHDFVVNIDKMDTEKGVMFFSPEDVSLETSAELTSILMPRMSADKRTHLTPATSQDAMRALLPSTVGGLMGGTAVTAGILLTLVKTVPAFYLELGSDLPGVVSSVANHLS